ncbi:hypothetical protein CMI39_01505 [Candidatus Pacearchaeota archaeon]|jgi:hypothetical protein|nr:hypothetical protein [Candidatus Pacearchaeota archaeon]|tara:strand:- start:8665 stop:10059 length:1395 start_codon:yes stop_codon:yes gene_type:complete
MFLEIINIIKAINFSRITLKIEYTKNKSKLVEKYLKEKIEIIVDTIRKRIPDTISIIMGGGFGKGEGSVVVKNKEVILINDFDMYVVAKKEYNEDIINDIAQEASRKIGKKGISSFIKFNKNRPLLKDFFYIDLKVIPYDYLKKLPPMVKYYDLRNSSKIVYGKNTLNEIPDFKPNNLPVAEGARLLLNRMSHLVQHFYSSFFTKNVRECDHQIFLLHTIKTYTDACGALLILSKKYEPTYSKRVDVFKKTYLKDFPELKKLIPEYVEKIKEFTELKINFNLGAYKKKDLELWKQSRNYIGISTKYFFEKFLGKKINNYYDLSKAIEKSAIKYYNPYIKYILKRKFKLNINNKYILGLGSIVAHIYMNFLYFNRMKEGHNKLYIRGLFRIKPPELTFFSALPLILFSLKHNGKVNLKMLEDGKRILQKVYPVNVKNEGDDLKYWEDIASVYSNAYVLFAFLKLK